MTNFLHSQVLGAPDSLSLISEPPDVRNWFSSYVYESPELNTIDDFEASGYREQQCNGEEKGKEKEENATAYKKNKTKDELVTVEKVASTGLSKSGNTAKNNIEVNNNGSQALDYSDSLSLSSEPTDITKWFSSYVYESPELDTSEDFRDSTFTSNDVEGNAKNCKTENGEKGKMDYIRMNERHITAPDQKIYSTSLAKCNSCDRDDKLSLQFDDKDFPVKMISEMEGKLTRNYNSGSTQKAENSSFNDQKNRMTPEKWKNRMDLIEESPAQTENIECLAYPGNLNSIKNNDKKNFAENGFISTRKNRRTRPNDENFLLRSVEPQFDCLKNRVAGSLVNEKEAVLRKPLAEATNFQQPHALEVTGKWKCPQKSKPNLGPPLKQLRLDRWVNRE
ncbi:hypothetical protein NMG60_11030239 [Bertholletia excelsa]